MKRETGSKFFSVLRLRSLTKRKVLSWVVFFTLIFLICVIGSICFRNAIRWVDKPFPGFLVNPRVVVGYAGQYHWTGVQSGLNFPDKIIKANGKVVSTAQDLEEVVQRNSVGSQIKYLIDRNGKQIDVAVATMRFTATDLLMTFGIFFFLGILYLSIGIVVFVLKPDTAVSWIFFFACSLMSVFTIRAFDGESTHFFTRFSIYSQTFLPAFVLHLSLLFPEKMRLVDKHPLVSAVPYVASTVLFLPFVVLYPRDSAIPYYKASLLYLNFSTLALISSSLWAYYKKSSALSRQRAKVVLFGVALALPIPALGPLFASMGSVVGKVKIITNYSSIPVVLFPASIAYAIAKHNLFDVDVYIKRAVGYVIMVAVVGTAFFSLQVVVRSFIMDEVFSGLSAKAYPIFFSVLVVFFFNPVNRRIRGFVDRLFYRKKFDYKEAVISVSNALTSVLNLDEIIRKMIDTVRREMFIDTSGVIVLDPAKEECQSLFIGDETDTPQDRTEDLCITYHDPLITLLSREKKLITKYDIAEDPYFAGVKEPCGSTFQELSASLAVPLVYQDEVKAILAVGHKKSGHFFTREDIDLLETVASQGAIAIENARLAEQMKKEETVRTNLARYLSPQIVDQIVRKDVQLDLGGDRKVVTVLFSDIRDFTTITETRPADELVHILNEYFTEMAGIIFGNQGSLDKYIGDAVVAVFGSLIPLENATRNAVNAAVGMMKRMPYLNERWRKEYDFSMHIGIGIARGEVFLGNIGSPERMEFTVIGDTVNVASRFSGLAGPGHIFLTKEAFSNMGTDIGHRELEPVKVKGKAEKMEVFEVLYKQAQ